MTDKQIVSISKLMSLVLRHNPDAIGLTLDKNGWAITEELIDGMNRAGRHTTLEILKKIVETNDKQRFRFNDDYTKIRANQGHSISVDVELKEVRPPNVLYHGTASRFIQSINNEGLRSKNRLYVHLTDNSETAVKVGARHGKAIVLTIDSAAMYNDGYKFYLSDNNVWLTDVVPKAYFLYNEE